MHENKALLFENATLKLYNDWDKAGYKQQPALCINDPLIIAWEYFLS